ncbi:MAG TPA: hypothetical protein VGK73_27875 [Polyangiaceae bacterium]
MAQGQVQVSEVSPVEAAFRVLDNAAKLAVALKTQHGEHSRQYRRAKLDVDAAREVYIEQLRKDGGQVAGWGH